MNAVVPVRSGKAKARKGLNGSLRTLAGKSPKDMIPKVRRPCAFSSGAFSRSLSSISLSSRAM